MTRWFLLVPTLAGILSAAARAEVDYTKDIKPIFSEKCVSCHGPLKQEAGLRLDAGKFVRAGSDSGSIASHQNPSASLLLERVRAGEAERMPPPEEGSPLKPGHIAALEAWIADGMQSPEDEPILGDPKDHWAYQPIQRPDVPQLSTQPKNPIDAFLTAKWQEKGIQPLPRADANTLLRRITIDLTGLPPTAEEVHKFAADDSPEAYERTVDHLLATNQYGERWGRHWMDVWRYSDWDGFQNELRGSQRHIWRWRDWIVNSLNADKGYDRMIVEMLAGDEITPTDPDVLAATGFLARNYHSRNRNIWLDAVVEHTAKAFLGMTLNCARCHDHKFDPIAQSEYYQFRAIFEPYEVRTDVVANEQDLQKDGLPRVYDADLDAKTYLYTSGDEKRPATDTPLSPAAPAIIDLPYVVEPVAFPLEVYAPAYVPGRKEAQLAEAEVTIKKARQALAESNDSAESKNEAKNADSLPPQRAELALRAAETNFESLHARWVADEAKLANDENRPNDNRIQELATNAAAAERRHKFAQAELDLFDKRAAKNKLDAKKLADKQTPAQQLQMAEAAIQNAEKEFKAAGDSLSQTDDKYTQISPQYPRKSTGRRSALARWITDRKNPLTARVAVNHIWMRHFGEPLVAEVFDFGLRAPRPVHADLLDWLSVEFMESGWSMKHLHRLIVTSDAYQAVSSANADRMAANRSKDADNSLFWCAKVQRLDAEAVRDSLLFVSGQLDLTQGGPEIDFQQGEQVRRRSIYFNHAYEKQMQMLVTFDAPSPTECYRRSPSIIPQQALALANSALGVSLARELAGELASGAKEDPEGFNDWFLDRAFLTILSRQPSSDERTRCNEFLIRQAKVLSDTKSLTSIGGTVKATKPPAELAEQRARENLIHVLMNHNDFISVR